MLLANHGGKKSGKAGTGSRRGFEAKIDIAAGEQRLTMDSPVDVQAHPASLSSSYARWGGPFAGRTGPGNRREGRPTRIIEFHHAPPFRAEIGATDAA